MTVSMLRLVRTGGGWQLLDNGKPAFWFPERSAGLEIARIMADARNLNHGMSTAVEAQNDDGDEFELVASFG